MQLKRFGLIALIIYIIFFGGATYGATNPFVHTIQLILVTGIIIGWLVHLIRHKQPFPQTPLDLPLLVYVLWLGITTLFSQDWRVSLEQSWLMIVHVIALYILVDLMRRGREQWIFESLFLLAALVIIVSLAEMASWYLGLGFGGFKQGWFPIGGFSDPIPPVGYRLSLAFNVSTWLGNFVVQSLPLVIAWGITARQKADRQALILVALGLVWVLAFSVTRGAILGIMVVIGIGGLLHIWRRGYFGQLRQRSYAIASLVLMGILFAAGIGLILLISQGAGRVSGDRGRVLLWESALDMIQDHPVNGVGVYQYGHALREYATMTPTTDHLKTAHNLYLNTGAEIGIPGILLMIWLAGAFLRAWWKAWQQASPKRQTRLIACLAALGGFSVQSLADTFVLTSTVLPFLMVVAYVIAEPRPQSQHKPVYASLRYGVGILMIGYLIWLGRVELAQFRLFQSTLALAEDDLDLALERVEAAHQLDPHLRLYDLQQAYLLGRLAEKEPDKHLEQAIATYEQVLDHDPAFHIGQSNLAALYTQQGDFAKALSAAEKAHTLRPDLWLYSLKLGEAQEALGMDEAAAQSYRDALLQSLLYPSSPRDYTIILANSGYWSDPSPAKSMGLQLAFESYSPSNRLIFAVRLGWQAQAADLAAQLGTKPTTPADFAALGFYAASLGDYQQSVIWYKKAGNEAWVYVELAKAYLALGDHDSAEEAARTALFLSPREGAEANFVLAHLTDDESQVNRLLIDAVSPRYLVQSYSDTVFGHLAPLDYLPQVRIPGSGEAAFEPWFWLAERYAEDDDENTDPSEVYRAIWDTDPYIERAKILCGDACE
jgi:O-antigen ligase/Flp pilus assembly protein TadD